MAGFTDVSEEAFLRRLDAEEGDEILGHVVDGGQQTRAVARIVQTNMALKEIFNKQPPTALIYDGTKLTKVEKTAVSACPCLSVSCVLSTYTYMLCGLVAG